MAAYYGLHMFELIDRHSLVATARIECEKAPNPAMTELKRDPLNHAPDRAETALVLIDVELPVAIKIA